MEIKDAIAESHNTAKEKGFWDNPHFNIGEKLMLITSELGEALEADRQSEYAKVDKFEKDLRTIATNVNPSSQEDIQRQMIQSFEANMKNTFEDEIADATIRIFDLAGKMDIDLEYFMRMKMQYNKTRAKLHGKKY